MKAPIANDSPSCWAMAPTPTPAATTATRNSSREPQPTTRRSIAGSSRVPTNTITSRKAPATSVACSSRPPTPSVAPSCGSTMRIGTTARSCTTSRPIITRLASVDMVPVAASVFSTTIVLESEIIAPNHNASMNGMPATLWPSQVPKAAVTMICSGPPMSAMRCTAREVAERHLEAEREEQQRHADLGQQLRCLRRW